jgi:hypothetical protein
MGFTGKSIFIWCYWVMFGGDVEKIAAALVEGGFEAAYVHTTDGTREAVWADHVNCTPALVAALKRAGLTVYGWGAPYGTNPIAEAQIAAAQTKRYGLAGYAFDAEGTYDKHPNAVDNTRVMLTEYKRLCPGVPTAWCWWAFHKNSAGTQIHPTAILAEAMRHCDAGMPMAYWNSETDDSAAYAVRYLATSYNQWKPYLTGKQFIPAGRAFYGGGLPGTPTPAAILAFDQAARGLGASGVNWWDMQHAIELPLVWGALKQTPRFEDGTGEPEPPGKDNGMTWTDNAIGLYTKTAGWTNKEFDFIVGYAGGDWSERGPNDWRLEPNPNLKPIEEQAHGDGKPFLALWDFDVSDYALRQIDAKESTWPNEANDYPLQALISALKNRNVDGLIIRVLNGKNRLGGEEMPEYVAFAAQKFVERANRWLYTTKGLDKWTFVLTNDSFLRTKGAQESYYRWTKGLWLGIEQEAARPLDSGAWPQSADKIKAVPPSLGWKIWYHYNAAALDMMLWNGTPEDMRAFLGYGGGTTPPPPPPPTGEYVTSTDFIAYQQQVAALFAAMEQQHAEQLAALRQLIPTGATITLTHD